MGWFTSLMAGSAESSDPDYSAALERVEKALAGMEERSARYLACVALLLAQIAHVDSHISEGEKGRMLKVLREEMGLPEPQAKLAVEIAAESALSHAIERYILIRELNELASPDQKAHLLRSLFEVACEEDISELESDQIGAIANSLLLPRTEFIAIRSEFREHRALLKNLKK